MKLFLIRHGESEANVNNDVYYNTPDFKINLTQRGIEQAKCVGQKLSKELDTSSFTLMIHSPFHRAKMTAHYLNEYVNLTMKECPLIYEQLYKPSFASFKEEYTSYSEEALDFSKYWYKEGGMESINDCYQRAVQFYMLLKTGYYKHVQQLVVVSHGTFLRCLIGVINQESVDEIIHSPDLQNCCLETYSI